MRELKVGLIGYGMAGRVFHAPVIAAIPGLRLCKVVERRGQTARERYPAIEVAREAAALFEDKEIELVVVATPSDSHFELAREALSADKHVVVDKPFTLAAAQAQGFALLAKLLDALAGCLRCHHVNVLPTYVAKLDAPVVLAPQHYQGCGPSRQAVVSVSHLKSSTLVCCTAPHLLHLRSKHQCQRFTLVGSQRCLCSRARSLRKGLTPT